MNGNLQGDDTAPHAVLYALSQPDNVNTADIMVMPTSQGGDDLSVLKHLKQKDGDLLKNHELRVTLLLRNKNRIGER